MVEQIQINMEWFQDYGLTILVISMVGIALVMYKNK